MGHHRLPKIHANWRLDFYILWQFPEYWLTITNGNSKFCCSLSASLIGGTGPNMFMTSFWPSQKTYQVSKPQSLPSAKPQIGMGWLKPIPVKTELEFELSIMKHRVTAVSSHKTSHCFWGTHFSPLWLCCFSTFQSNLVQSNYKINKKCRKFSKVSCRIVYM